VVVCYDVSDDRRRSRLMKHLKAFLEHVQKSVFEGPLDGGRFERMRRGIPGKIDMEKDAVRVYSLCRRCSPVTEVIGLGITVDEEEKDVVV